MDDIKKISGYIGAYAAISLIIIYLQLKSWTSPVFPFIFRVLIPLVTLYYGYKAIRFFGFNSFQGKSIFFMVVAMFISWMGNIFWIANTPEAG